VKKSVAPFLCGHGVQLLIVEKLTSLKVVSVDRSYATSY